MTDADALAHAICLDIYGQCGCAERKQHACSAMFGFESADEVREEMDLGVIEAECEIEDQ